MPEKLRGPRTSRPPASRCPASSSAPTRPSSASSIPAARSERELSAWIAPRLEVIQYSIRQAPLSPELRDGIRTELDRVGLLTGPDKRDTVGCFVRSDTNVEDLDNFNGAGLNLTLFNLKSLDDIYDGLKEVWASPFSYRSFSWRQTLIDEPLWVLPSVVILESVPSEKSGVLVTGDPETGERGKMLVATSEGVGGAVDGTSAETLLWSPEQRRAGDDVQVAVAPDAAGGRLERDRRLDRPRHVLAPTRARPSSSTPAGVAQRDARAGARSGRRAAAVGHRVRLRRRQALALPVPAVRRQRRAEERDRPRRARGPGRRRGPTMVSLEEKLR